MTYNFSNPFANNLVGLWDFLDGGKTKDTGLADGIAQNGHLEGGANISGGQLHLNADACSYFDVSGQDMPFDLSKGTIEVQFTQDPHADNCPGTLVNRGEYADKSHEGWLSITVNQYGQVELKHYAVDEHGNTVSEKLETDKDLITPGDHVNVVYSWDANTGVSLTVTNLSTGHSETLSSDEKGLTLDIGDNDDENFTFGAREKDDGQYDDFFDGKIDYVAVYDTSIASAPVADGIITGDDGDDVIDAGFVDEDGEKIDNSDALLPGEGPQDDIVYGFDGNDVVRAGAGDDDVYGGDGNDQLFGEAGDDLLSGGAGHDMLFGGDGNDTLLGGDGDDKIEGSKGNDHIEGGAGKDDLWGGLGNDVIGGGAGDDTINAGDGTDTVYGGSGDDTILGGSGDDTLYGDTMKPGEKGGQTVRESFEWDKAPNTNLPQSFSQNTGNVTVTFSTLQETGHANTILGTNAQNVSDIDADGAPVDAHSSLDNVLNGRGNEADYRLAFDHPVSDVSFRINDIDGDGVVKVTAYGADGKPILVQLDAGDRLTALDTDGVLGTDTVDSQGGYLEDTSNEYSVLVSIPGPVTRIEIEHDQDGGNNSGINITDVYFDVATVDTGAPGNDTINGGDGDDAIFGEGGDDILTGGIGNDVIEGGDGNDLIFGDGTDDCGDENFFEDRAQDISNIVLYFDTDADGAIDYSVKIDGFPDSGTPTHISNDLDDYFGQVLNYVYTENPDLVGASVTAGVSIKGGTEPTQFYAVSGNANGDAPDAGPTLNTGPGNDLELAYADFYQSYDPTLGSGGSGGSFNDVIDGGDGDDTILGECGDDVITGGAGADTIFGGDDRDTIFGAAGDTVDGGAGGLDHDILDLTGQGPFYLDNVTPDSNGNGINGTVVFVDGAGQPTGDTITFVEIEEVRGDEINRGPDAVDDAITVDEDTIVTIDVLGNDTDPEGDPLTVTDASSPNGTVTINPDGTLEFTPAPDFNGDTTISYTIDDGNGGTDTATVFVHVTPVNDAPTAVDDSDTTNEDVAVVVDLLGNDFDVDGDALSVTAVSVPADQGTVVNNGDGTATFTPAPDFNGTATLSYTISDPDGLTDDAVHTIEVAPVADRPDAENDVAQTDEDTPVTIDVLANDDDPDGDPLTVTEATSPDGVVEINPDGTLTFTPGENFNGDTEISYTVTDPDGNTDTATVFVHVAPVNDAPTAVDDSDTTNEDVAVVVDLLGNDFDVDGDALSVTAVSVPADQGTVVNNGDGTATFTPAPDFNGTATLSYTISDPDGLTDDAVHTIEVAPVADRPDAENDVAQTDEDTPVTIDVLANDDDPDGDPLTVTEATSPDGVVEINPDGTLTFTPGENFNGDTEISYTVTDPDGNTDTATVFVHVAPVNDAPTAVDDSDDGLENQPVTVDLLANDFDVDGDDLTVIAASVPADQGTLVDNGDGTVTFNPATGFVGLATISYTIEDEGGLTDDAVHTINVVNVNDAPDAVDDVVAGPLLSDTPVVVDALVNDTDPDGDDLTIIAVSVAPEQGVVEIVGNQVVFTPNAEFEGTALIDYTIEDEEGLTDSATISVPVSNGIVNGTDGADVIDLGYVGDPGGDRVDALDELLPGEGPNDDIIEAGAGDDVIIAGAGNDTVFAGSGDDRVHGGPGDDEIFGEDGDDTINGGAGDDTVDGGAGHDTINTGEGSDTVFGGDGNDIIDTSDASPTDLGKIDQSYPGVFDGEGDPDDDPALVLDDRDFVDGGAGDDIIRTGDDADTIFGGSGNDTIDGGIDDDIIDGGDGDDRIVGGEGDDIIDGGRGDDTIYAGNDPDLGLDIFDLPDDGFNSPFGPDLVPDNGKDVVRGGEGNDTIFGADDDDMLYGDAGDDYIDGGVDDDFIDGGTGHDTLLGGAGNDTILGGAGDDFIDGGLQADDIDGGAGDDTIFGGNGADTIRGGDGNDIIDGGTGDDTLLGDAGDDTITGATGDDIIDGGAGNDLIDGGNGGNDTMFGGADRDTFINVDAGETVDGGSEGDDFDVLDLRGSAPSNGSLSITRTGPDSNGNGFDGFVTYFDGDGNTTGTLTFSEIEEVIPCFTPGTRIATPRGEVRVEELKVGDLVMTRDSGLQAIRWIGNRVLTAAELAQAAHLKPVMIRQGALGGGLPERDMMVSPNHRVLIANEKTALYFEASEVLVAAKHLTGMDGVESVDVPGVTYLHVMFDQHEVILSDGAWTESFQPGDMTLGSMGDAQRAEILELFPELATRKGVDTYVSARRSLKKHEARLLVR